MSSPLPLTGRVALVTGATRLRGIGAAICRRLAERGAALAFTHWRAYDAAFPWAGEASDPDHLASELAAFGAAVAGFEVDLAAANSAAALFGQVESHLGPVSILVNNAAYSTLDSWETLTAESLDAHHAVNVRATALLSVELVRRFEAGAGGRIINMTSGQGRGPMPEELAYAASKGAIEAVTVSLSVSAATRGITVNAVNPGPTDTGWMSDELMVELAPRFPFGRAGEPDDAARLVAWLASDDAAWITGQIVNSEGGFLRQ